MLITRENESALHLTIGLDCRAPRRKVFETWTEPQWLGSRIDFTHGIFATHESKELHAEGWMRCFHMLEKVLEE